MSPTPDFSVILVSDYASGDERSWDNFRRTLRALAAQTYTGPVECVLAEYEETSRQMPSDFLELLPTLRTVRSSAAGSYALKNCAVREARAPFIVILDGDCTPGPDWLAQIAAAWRAHPDAAVISGRTTYEGKGLLERLSGLLSRAYVDRGTVGVTQHISNNNATWRRSVYLKHPLPEGLGPFAGRIQSEAVLRAGGKSIFMPEIAVIHEFEGWRMEADLRRNCGYGTVIARLTDAQMPHARLVRMGRISIPAIWAGKTLDSWRDVLRCWRHFGLRVVELPLALFLAPVVIAMEVPGMLAAFGNRPIGRTEYR